MEIHANHTKIEAKNPKNTLVEFGLPPYVMVYNLLRKKLRKNKNNLCK